MVLFFSFFYRFIEVLLLVLNICKFKVYNVIRYRYILQNGNPLDRGAWQATVHGVARVGHNLATKPPPRQPPVPSKAVPWTGPFPDSSSFLGACLSSAAWPRMLSVPLFCRPSAAGDLWGLELELIPVTCKAFRVEGRFFENHSEAAALN